MDAFPSYEVKVPGSDFHHIVSTTIADSSRLVEIFFHELMKDKKYSMLKDDGQKVVQVVGLAIEYCGDVVDNDDDGSNTSINTNNKVATLQLCFGNLGILVQLLHLKDISMFLRCILENEKTYAFVGVGIRDSLDKLKRDYGLECSSAIELGPLASRVCHKSQYFDSNLEGLSREIARIKIEKPTIPSLTLWGARDLRNEQIDYAITKAYASYLIGETLKEWTVLK